MGSSRSRELIPFQNDHPTSARWHKAVPLGIKRTGSPSGFGFAHRKSPKRIVGTKAFPGILLNAAADVAILQAKADVLVGLTNGSSPRSTRRANRHGMPAHAKKHR